ncbi:hypothetical protein HS088_TW13G01321 [Tripterygium wilfordii]|uniref:Uncharacterized protein n=1 Tax=Tripterygium wilfordii TaxID=458696 RepID=A0A7J7CWA9_TRIWF|nr:uncharacterized protein LOC120012078 [Tripterygium wilfordii]KAF5738422.1 hypothetical protein HS088_TW13G01321 [Tripterygium wilfordii]
MSKMMELQKSLLIKEDDKFFNRLMSKELMASSSSSNISSHHYYVGASGAVPFMWESQPGTPKHVIFSDISSSSSSLIPPLTPPPSHNNKSSMQMVNNKNNRKSKTRCFTNIFLSWKNIMFSPSSPLSYASPSSDSSLSSSRSSSFIKSKNHRRRCQYQCFSLRSGDHVHDCDDYEEDDHEQAGDASGLSPDSPLCNGVINKCKKKIVMKGYCRYGSVKSALLSIAGRRSA